MIDSQYSTQRCRLLPDHHIYPQRIPDWTFRSLVVRLGLPIACFLHKRYTDLTLRTSLAALFSVLQHAFSTHKTLLHRLSPVFGVSADLTVPFSPTNGLLFPSFLSFLFVYTSRWRRPKGATIRTNLPPRRRKTLSTPLPPLRCLLRVRARPPAPHAPLHAPRVLLPALALRGAPRFTRVHRASRPTRRKRPSCAMSSRTSTSKPAPSEALRSKVV